jgi:hypothetical protein
MAGGGNPAVFSPLPPLAVPLLLKARDPGQIAPKIPRHLPGSAPASLEYSIGSLTCAFASSLDVVMVSLPGAAQERLRAHRSPRNTRPTRPSTWRVGEAHLRTILAEYQVHYDTARPHQGIAQRAPDGEHDSALLTVADLESGRIQRKPILGDLINEYSRAA